MVWSAFQSRCQSCSSKFLLVMLLAHVELLGCYDVPASGCVTNTYERRLQAMELAAQLPLTLEPTS